MDYRTDWNQANGKVGRVQEAGNPADLTFTMEVLYISSDNDRPYKVTIHAKTVQDLFVALANHLDLAFEAEDVEEDQNFKVQEWLRDLKDNNGDGGSFIVSMSINGKSCINEIGNDRVINYYGKTSKVRESQEHGSTGKVDYKRLADELTEAQKKYNPGADLWGVALALFSSCGFDTLGSGYEEEYSRAERKALRANLDIYKGILAKYVPDYEESDNIYDVVKGLLPGYDMSWMGDDDDDGGDDGLCYGL